MLIKTPEEKRKKEIPDARKYKIWYYISNNEESFGESAGIEESGE